MTRWIVGSSIRLGRLVIAMAIAVVGFGIFQVRSAPVGTYPEFMPPTVQIRTEALGLSAAEVEQLITVPVEQDLLNGVPWLDHIDSQSMTGLSSIDLVFEPGTDILDARQMVQERLTQVAALPNVGSRPAMLQPLSSTSRVLMIGLSSQKLSLIDMSVLARWKIRPRLMGVPGVANVAIWGQRDRQLQVQVDPDRLRAMGVTLNQVVKSTGNALWSSPLTFVEASTPGTGGFIDTANQRFGVQHILPITSAKQLAAVTMEDHTGKPLRLGDVANVVEGHQPLIGDALGEQGRPDLLLVIQKFPEADTLQVTRDVEAAMTAMAPGLSGIHFDTSIYRPASFIESSLRTVGLAGLASLALVLLVLLAFTFSWRVTLIAMVALPVSLAAAVSVLVLRGTMVSSITIAGLVVALGVLVDDAVVDVHSIGRRLRRRRGGTDTDAVADAVVDGSSDMRGPLMYATIVLLLVVAPLVFQAGVPGAFSREVVTSYALAVVASMAVALTLTPALAAMLLPGDAGRRRSSPLVRWTKRGFDRVAPRFTGSTGWTVAAVGALCLVALAALPQLGSRSLLPTPKDRDLLVQIAAPPSTSLPEMARITRAMTHEVRSIQGVRDVGAHLGRAVSSDQVVDVNSGELWVDLAGSADYTATVNAVQRAVKAYPGIATNLLTYPQQQLGTVSSGPQHDVTVRVFGEDLGVLRTEADTVRRSLAHVAGVSGAQVQAPVEEPTMEIEVDLAAAQRYGIKPGDVRREAATMLSGLLVGNLYEQQKIFDVVVWGSPQTRHDLTSVRDLLIDTPSGGHVRLGDVASVRVAPYPVSIQHQGVSRFLDVTADVRGRSVGAVRQDVQNRVQSLTFPLEYHAEVVGIAAGEQSNTGRALGFAIAALIGIFLLFQAATGSWRVATALFLVVPLAVAGGLLAAPLGGGLMSVGALLGLLLVLGVATRNVLVLVARYQGLEREDGAARGSALVLRGTRDRLLPVILTAVALAAALLPFVLLGDSAGTEILHPMAVVALGGLVTSTLLTLLVVPSLYLRFAPGLRFATSEEESHETT